MSRLRVVLTWSARIAATAIVLVTLALFGLYQWLTVDLPSPDRLYERAAAPSTRIYDRHGRLLYEIFDPHGGAHTPVPMNGFPQACIDATIATEDASFYDNPGVDGLAIIRALWINLQGGEILSGGSTITQQLARNLLLSPEERTQVTLERKLRESILAWRIARTYDKDDILTLYLNETYYGNLAYGLEAAANTYFAKSAAELDLAECALLAGLPQSPAGYNPLENPVAAKERQTVVLGLLAKHGLITEDEADQALMEDLQFASTPFPIDAPHFVMLVRGQLEREFGLEAIYRQGLQVHTTLDLDAQKTAERIVERRLGQLASASGSHPPRNVSNAAVVVLEPYTGEVLAMVGSPDYFDPRIDGAVNVAVATRQPGSSIKPITYAAAFDPTRDEPLTAATMMVDVRTVFVTQEGDPYVPRNYDRQWHGPVLLRQALASSYNLVAVKVLDHVGVDDMAQQARKMGITTFDDAGSDQSGDRFGLSLTLGGGEVRLLELTAAYGAFANGGYRVEPVLISRVEDSEGQVLKVWETSPGLQVMDERVAYLITDILSDDFARISTFGEGSVLNLTRPAAVKTGTTTDWRDNWTVGYTPELVVGVWAGNADNAPMENVSGVTGAAPIWHDVMESLHKGRPVREFVEPAGMMRVEVCADSGLLPQERLETEDWRLGYQPAPCAHTVNELFIEGTEPTRVDDWHWTYALDARNGLMAGPGCLPEYTVQKRYTLYPAEALDWAMWQGIPQPPGAYSPLCPGGAETGDWRPETGERSVSSLQSLIMTSPDQGGHYRLSPELPAASQQLFVAVRPVDGVTLQEVALYVDGHLLATLTGPPYQARWLMTPGTHTFWAVGVDVGGRVLESDRVVITVE
jgi:1A family penicillin-binding protein